MPARHACLTTHHSQLSSHFGRAEHCNLGDADLHSHWCGGGNTSRRPVQSGAASLADCTGGTQNKLTHFQSSTMAPRTNQHIMVEHYGAPSRQYTISKRSLKRRKRKSNRVKCTSIVLSVWQAAELANYAQLLRLHSTLASRRKGFGRAARRRLLSLLDVASLPVLVG